MRSEENEDGRVVVANDLVVAIAFVIKVHTRTRREDETQVAAGVLCHRLLYHGWLVPSRMS